MVVEPGRYDPLAEEQAYLHRSPPPSPPLPVPSQPFPFLKLPREIRDQVYCYALRPSRRRHYPRGEITDTCHLSPRNSANPRPRTIYQAARIDLFLVNRQISHEALELFYSTHTFYFGSSLRDTLSPWARSLITRIRFMSSVFTWPLNAHALRREEEEGQAYAAAVELLPNVKWVSLSFVISGFDVPEHEVKGLVARILKIVGPLKAFAGLHLEDHAHETDQRIRVMKEVSEELSCQ